jgi:RNA polymerase sigma-70 factor (ECF subfamily)
MPTDYGQMDDDALIQAVRQGVTDAFEPLLDRHLQHVRTFIALRAPVAQLVDEVAHEAFVFAHRHLDEFAPGTSFQAWLRAIAWNLLRAEVQRFSRQQSHLARYAEQKWAEAAETQAGTSGGREMEFLEECVRQVPPPMQELLTLKYQDACSSDEIARRLQRSLAWVRTGLFRLRQQLKDCIEGKLSRGRPC